MIIISPFAKKLRNGKENPKNYPYWKELVQEIEKTMQVVQVGVEGELQLTNDFRRNLSLNDLKMLISQCKTWIGVDSMFQHLAWDMGKKGIVLWSVSDPNIFGHPENINLIGSRDNLKEQFLWWEYVAHDPQKFVKPQEVIKALQSLNLC